jgi:hypothetical protein
MDPLIWLWERYKVAKFLKLPNEKGIKPVILSPSRYKYCRFVKFHISKEMGSIDLVVGKIYKNQNLSLIAGSLN